MIGWKSIETMQTLPTDERDYLLWCPNMGVSGPSVVGYWAGDEWLVSWTNSAISVPITHYAEIEGPRKL